jgi:hypothetical protein
MFLSSWIQRLRRAAVMTRRVLAAVVGLGVLLVLSGSQGVLPLAVAQGHGPAAAGDGLAGNSPPTTDPSLPGTLGATLPTPPATIPPFPGTSLPVGIGQTPKSTGPYGLTSTTQLTSSGIPQAAYLAYVAAATSLARTDPSCGLTWPIIAGIGRVESNHGRFGGSSIQSNGLVAPPILGVRLDGSRAGNARISDSDGGKWDGDAAFDRAVGPMQFLPGTWKIYGGGGNPQNINDAALATGRYLCAGNASLSTQQGRWAAVYRYNHSDSYVSLVLSLADAYASGQAGSFPARPTGGPPPDKGPPATTPGPPPAVPVAPTSPTATPTPTPTVSVSTSPTVTPTPTGTSTPTATPTETPTPTPTTPTPTDTPTTATPTPTTPTPTTPTSTTTTPTTTTPVPDTSTDIPTATTTTTSTAATATTAAAETTTPTSAS